MTEWVIETTSKYEKTHKDCAKKHPDELKAVLNNLDTYFTSLKTLGHPLQIKAGFIHNESRGIKAIDQKGGDQKTKLKQTRLYVYPSYDDKILYLILIGDKNSQKRDIRYCLDFVR